MSRNAIRAFSDPKYTYYRLTKDFGILKAGTIFYHDPSEQLYGSPAAGCLIKLEVHSDGSWDVHKYGNNL